PTGIEVDAVDTGAELLNETQPPRLGEQFLRHRSRHYEGDISVAQDCRTGSQAVFLDEADGPVRRHRRRDRYLDVRVKLVENGDLDVEKDSDPSREPRRSACQLAGL